jgi:hypothetical protein
MIDRLSMPLATSAVFELLAKDKNLTDFILVGGTALSLQLSHRLSEDLDFWLPANKLDKAILNQTLNKLKEAGMMQSLATPSSKITEARINGFDLLALAQDHVVNGVKVTFFARNELQDQMFAGMPQLKEPGISFSIMSEVGIFAMKSWLITQRVKSRDLFDLMTFMLNQGKTLEDIFKAGQDADPSYSKEYAKEVLMGSIPLDKDDPGYNTLNINESPADVHRFFKTQIDLYEQDIAGYIAKNTKHRHD